MGTPLIYLFFLKMTDISSLTPGFGSALLPQGSLPPGPRQPIPSRATSWPHRPCNPSPPGLLSAFVGVTQRSAVLCPLVPHRSAALSRGPHVSGTLCNGARPNNWDRVRQLAPSVASADQTQCP